MLREARFRGLVGGEQVEEDVRVVSWGSGYKGKGREQTSPSLYSFCSFFLVRGDLRESICYPEGAPGEKLSCERAT